MRVIQGDNKAKSVYTAIISDLHLCEAEPDHQEPKLRLWKKYKRREFFFDQTFADFLNYIHHQAQGRQVELVLNGDIFDFDSVMALPEFPTYRISWLERLRGLNPEAEKSAFKMQAILDDHPLWVEALRQFICRGHRAVFVIGNHDLELHFNKVQDVLLHNLQLPDQLSSHVQINEWFYISEGDTLIEHGNQYDPYCVCRDPVHPFVQRYNRLEVRVPFGNLATRYMINGMGFFNPHVDSNFIMSIREYIVFFYKYMMRAQPFLIWTWFWGAVTILVKAVGNTIKPSFKDPLTIEDKYERVAVRSKATPRMVRELKELAVEPAASDPFLIMKELWLDRAFMVIALFYVLLQGVFLVKQVYNISFFWMFIPLFLFLPFFLFYSRTITSGVLIFKEPQESKLEAAAYITKVKRIVYGHTHIMRHEIIGTIEHLNSGCWSPAFLDVECRRPIDQKTFVWIEPAGESRRASLLRFENKQATEVFRRKGVGEPLMQSDKVLAKQS